jgi:hypothetical protein
MLADLAVTVPEEPVCGRTERIVNGQVPVAGRRGSAGEQGLGRQSWAPYFRLERDRAYEVKLGEYSDGSRSAAAPEGNPAHRPVYTFLNPPSLQLAAQAMRKRADRLGHASRSASAVIPAA